MKALSIIIPYYNAKKYTDELLAVLAPQITKDTEVILIDDGSKVPYKTRYKWCRVIRKENGGCASARNMGLDNSTGDYISFIDADDMVPDYFIERLFEKISESSADVIDFSWKSLNAEGTQHDHILKSDDDYLTNPSVCTRAFRRSFIGDVRFNEQKDSTEDEDFSRKIGYLDKETKMIHAAIPEYMYFYRTAVTDSKIKRFKKGLMKTKRITYYYRHVTADMSWLLDEIKKEDELNEVWLLTDQNDIPELKRYCQVHAPMSIWTHYLRGEPYNDCNIIPVPIKTQVVIYCEYANKIGGISTFIYNFCQHMRAYYDILVLFDSMDSGHIKRLLDIVPARKNDGREIVCDTLILNRLTDQIPHNVSFQKSVQICHACYQKSLRIPTDRDILINVSQAAKKSWGAEASKGIVINNLSYSENTEALMIVSATRMASARDKGDNELRIRKLAKMLNDEEIPFIWLNFSDKEMVNPPDNFINMSPRLNVQEYIRKADYLVQLSDQEAYSYSVLEALTNNTAVICTPVDSFFEEGVEDGKTGYIIPFDMEFDVKKLLKVPRFHFSYDNGLRVGMWRKILGDTKPIGDYKPGDTCLAEILQGFTDKYTGQHYEKGDTISFNKDRIEELLRSNHQGELIRVVG